MKKKELLVSVVIPTYNEEANIGQCIETMLNQSYKKFEIIIVDDGSKDSTREIVKNFSKKHKNISLIEGQHKGPGFSRNLGAKKAKGTILNFADADMTFDKDYLKYLVLPILEGKSIGTEERHQKASNLDNIWSRCWGQYVTGDRWNPQGKGYVFRAILKSKFIELGGFDPQYGYADDQTFAIKYGLLPDLADKSTCYHKNPASLKEVYSQSSWIGGSISLQKPILAKKSLFIPLLISSIIAFIPLSFYIFLKKLITKKFKPSSLSDIGALFLFSIARVLGTTKGILRRNIKRINYR